MRPSPKMDIKIEPESMSGPDESFQAQAGPVSSLVYMYAYIQFHGSK